MHIVYIPEEIYALQHEIPYHPPLMFQLMTVTEDDALGIIAAYCNIVLDGVYTVEDVRGIAALCVRRLQEKRLIVVPNQ